MACSLPETLTPSGASLTPDTKKLFQKPPQIWGKLLPTFGKLRKFDLEKPTFVLGRDPKCDVILSEETVPKKKLVNFSKNHFRIDQGGDNLVYITDLSKNGTFLNGKLIGTNKQCILQHDDNIAIAFKALKIYVYKSIMRSDQIYLPPALRQKYETASFLGKGACGEVRLVFDKYTCQPFACKRIMKSMGSTKKLNRPENIKKEIDILKQLQHPFVISVVDVEESPNAFFFVMEYMEGGELSHLIHSPKRLTEPQVKFLFYQIVIAVQYLHDMNVTHRDLKPENILLKNDTKDENVIKLSDFGLSKMLSEQSLMKTQCGTPSFVAPEVLDPSVTQYGKKVDVWSLGVILYYMFAQELPFRAPTTAALCKIILTGRYKLINSPFLEVSNTVKDLIVKMLVCDPKKRLSIDQVVDHPWFIEDEPLRVKMEELLYTKFQTRQLESEDFDSSLHKSKRIKLEVVESEVD